MNKKKPKIEKLFNKNFTDGSMFQRNTDIPRSPLLDRMYKMMNELYKKYDSIISSIPSENTIMFMRSPDMEKEVTKQKIMLLSQLILNEEAK